jgi:hypothetical protein
MGLEQASIRDGRCSEDPHQLAPHQFHHNANSCLGPPERVSLYHWSTNASKTLYLFLAKYYAMKEYGGEWITDPQFEFGSRS